MSANTHCPYRQSTLLQQALAPDKMRIGFLLGAGCPVSVKVEKDGVVKPLIPDIRGLTKHVADCMGASETFKAGFSALLARFDGGQPVEPTIEDVLTHIRALHDVLRNGSLDGLNRDVLYGLDAEICRITTDIVNVDLPHALTPYHRLSSWIAGADRSHAVEIFTPNYDLLAEQALERHKIPYFDGFVGAKEAFFDLPSIESDALPKRWVRLWKLHGSITWWRTANDEIVRKYPGADGDRQMIYPSHLKYDQSRRMPYLAMLDRLKAFLSRGQAVLVVSGYSFVDQHLNEVILHGLRSNPNAVCFGLLYGPRANYQEALKKASLYPNLSLLAADGAVLGTVERDWHSTLQPQHPLHGLSVIAKEIQTADGQAANKCEFTLGDFKDLGSFLARQLSVAGYPVKEVVDPTNDRGTLQIFGRWWTVKEKVLSRSPSIAQRCKLVPLECAEGIDREGPQRIVRLQRA